jgi:hypothetical protein
LFIPFGTYPFNLRKEHIGLWVMRTGFWGEHSHGREMEKIRNAYEIIAGNPEG